jgi:hypothetical protein
MLSIIFEPLIYTQYVLFLFLLFGMEIIINHFKPTGYVMHQQV